MERGLDYEVLETLVSIGKFDILDMLRFLVKRIIGSLEEIKRCAIFRVFPQVETLRLVVGEPIEGHGLGMRFSFSELEALREVVETKHWVLIEDPMNDPRTKNSRGKIRDEHINAIFLIPLIVVGEVQDIIAVDATNEKKEFSQEEIQSALILSNSASLLLERDHILKDKAKEESLLRMGKVVDEALHKLRNPIQYIYGISKRLLAEAENWPVPWTLKDYAERILQGSSSLEKMIDSLGNFSRHRKTDVKEVNVNEVIRCLSRELIAGDGDFRFGYSLDQNLPSIVVDLSDIREMILPILHNAIEATSKEGEIRIKSEHDNGHIRISISNNGGCISEEIIGEIFNPFFTTKQDGTGMGLATAMEIARIYRGDITVENEPNLSLTTFTIKLPF